MTTARLGAVVTIAAALFVPQARAAAQASGESRAAILLTLPASARGLALGEAWSVVADDESALFYNPAQLARVGGVAAGGSVQRYIASTALAAFAVAIPVARGVVAAGLQALDYGSEAEIVPDGVGGEQGSATGSTVSAQDIALTAGYAASIGASRRLRVGVAAKWARQHVADVSGSAIAVDIGAAFTTANGWEMSSALQHLGSSLTLAAVRAPLPWTWRVGVAAPSVRGDRFTFRPMVEARQSSGGVATGVLAAEATWQSSRGAPVLSARTGYALRGTGDDRLPLTAGGGIALGRVAVDYAYEGFTLLAGATHRVGVRFTAPPRAP